MKAGRFLNFCSDLKSVVESCDQNWVFYSQILRTTDLGPPLEHMDFIGIKYEFHRNSSIAQRKTRNRNFSSVPKEVLNWIQKSHLVSFLAQDHILENMPAAADRAVKCNLYAKIDFYETDLYHYFIWRQQIIWNSSNETDFRFGISRLEVRNSTSVQSSVSGS